MEDSNQRLGDSEIFLEWKAPSRPFKERDKSWFTTVAVIVVLVSLVAILLQEFLLLGVVFALAFVSYILATKPPRMITCKIGSKGIYLEESFYPWEGLEDFWFETLGEERGLFVSLKKGFPSRLIVILTGVSEERVGGILREHLKFVPVSQKDWMERSARWLSSKVGLD